jgi:hypothetical protein
MEGRHGIHQILGGDAEVSAETVSGLNNNSGPAVSSKMKVLPGFALLFSLLSLTLERKFPVLSKRRALSTPVTVLIILIIIGLGVLIVYEIATVPSVTTTTVSSTTSTTSVYP